MKSRAIGVCKVISIRKRGETISSGGAVFVPCNMDLQGNMMIFLFLWRNQCPPVFFKSLEAEYFNACLYHVLMLAVLFSLLPDIV